MTEERAEYSTVKMTPWLSIRDDGYPVRSGWYDWKLWFYDGGASFVSLSIMAMYYAGSDCIFVDGREISLRQGDYWRGIRKEWGDG